MSTKYVYTPLNGTGRQIRLVTICPGIWSDIIECILHTTSLDDSPRYEALSYVWGDANKKVPISLDGRTFEVTENLYYALRRLRSTSSTRSMWIDAICINQSDDDEKSIQVNMMGSIFANYQRAVLWLGEDLELIGNATASSSPPLSSVGQRAFQLLRILGQDRHINELICFSATGNDHELIVHPYFREHFESVKAITDAPWWTRIWVLQEMALPGQIEFAFASETCPYTVMTNLEPRHLLHLRTCCIAQWYSLYKNRGIYQVISDFFPSMEPLVSVRESLTGDSQISLFYLREEFWAFRATDPRDFIYGLLGMVTDWGGAEPLIPDYKLPLSTVVCEALFRCIKQSKNLKPLMGIRRLSDNEGLPSWVPDLRLGGFKRTSAMKYQGFKTIIRNLFKASKLPCSKVNLVSNSVLRTESLRVTTIKVVGEPILLMGDGNELSARHSAIRQWMTMCDIQDWPADPPPETSVESQFWRALLNDCVFLGSKPRSKYRATQDDYYTMKDYLLPISRSDLTVDLPYGFNHWNGIALVESAMFLTESGMVGIGPAKCREGDEIHVLPGSSVPFILRPNASARLYEDCSTDGAEGEMSIATSPPSIPSYSVIGDGFLHGIMDGEAEQNNLGYYRTVDLV
ncbi:HET-domain-containing protein [Hypoxylon sp. FL1857]|nr:HET-domain-containing protein [Hypoxylon sp. FL1857]